MLTAPALFEDLGYALATNYLFLREQLTDEQLDLLRRVRMFVDDEVLPMIGDYRERAEMPWPLIRRLGEFGVVGYCLQLGRLAERDQLSDTIAGLAKLNNTGVGRDITGVGAFV